MVVVICILYYKYRQWFIIGLCTVDGYRYILGSVNKAKGGLFNDLIKTTICWELIGFNPCSFWEPPPIPIDNPHLITVHSVLCPKSLSIGEKEEDKEQGEAPRGLYNK
ncbi:hypothetical protein [Parabacteroides sp.]|uniref:hypothetical protein n=1 Tax=Parabacteroides sp. TaxID=1869337 RepID=UPI002579B5B5|nr:hypothetical protein [Parabacteroides sp.]